MEPDGFEVDSDVSGDEDDMPLTELGPKIKISETELEAAQRLAQIESSAAAISAIHLAAMPTAAALALEQQEEQEASSIVPTISDIPPAIAEAAAELKQDDLDTVAICSQ